MGECCRHQAQGCKGPPSVWLSASGEGVQPEGRGRRSTSPQGAEGAGMCYVDDVGKGRRGGIVVPGGPTRSYRPPPTPSQSRGQLGSIRYGTGVGGQGTAVPPTSDPASVPLVVGTVTHPDVLGLPDGLGAETLGRLAGDPVDARGVRASGARWRPSRSSGHDRPASRGKGRGKGRGTEKGKVLTRSPRS